MIIKPEQFDEAAKSWYLVQFSFVGLLRVIISRLWRRRVAQPRSLRSTSTKTLDKRLHPVRDIMKLFLFLLPVDLFLSSLVSRALGFDGPVVLVALSVGLS